MRDESGDRAVLSPMAQNLLRILIASYFLAGGIGLIPGTDLSPLTERLLPLVDEGRRIRQRKAIKVRAL